jgi:hypothetical protein
MVRRGDLQLNAGSELYRKVVQLTPQTSYARSFILAKGEGWHAVAQLVEALRYKPEGRGIDSRWCHWNFSLT